MADRIRDTRGAEQLQCEFERLVNLYLDGELPAAEHRDLFAHLSACGHCRDHLEATIEFRRMVSHDRTELTPAADEKFLERLAAHRSREGLVDRQVERNPLWRTRKSVSVGASLVAALLIFLAGFFTSPNGIDESELPVAIVEGYEERVDLTPVSVALSDAIYVYYPDIVVEAERPVEQEAVASESM